MNALRTVVEQSSVIVCCGSGGAGKTTTAAALGYRAACDGRRVVVVTIDPARRLAEAFGMPGGLAREPQPIDLGARGTGASSDDGHLWMMMLDPAAMLQRVIARHATDAEQAERIAANDFFRTLTERLSGTQEYMATEALYELHTDQRFDLVIVDTPPSRNALDFLESPALLTRFLSHRVFKAMMLPTRTGLRIAGTASQLMLRQVGKIVGSDVLADAAAFFQAFAGMETGFQERAVSVTELLRNPRTRFVLVASPQHDTITEAMWFAEQLTSADYEVAAAVINQLVPEFGPGTADNAADRAEIETEWVAGWRNLADLRRLAAAQRSVVEPLHNLVGAERVVEVPRLAADVHDLDGLDKIGRHLLGTIRLGA